MSAERLSVVVQKAIYELTIIVPPKRKIFGKPLNILKEEIRVGRNFMLKTPSQITVQKVQAEVGLLRL